MDKCVLKGDNSEDGDKMHTKKKYDIFNLLRLFGVGTSSSILWRKYSLGGAWRGRRFVFRISQTGVPDVCSGLKCLF